MQGIIANKAQQLARMINDEYGEYGVRIGIFVDHQTGGWKYLGSESAVASKKNKVYHTAGKLYDYVRGYGRQITYHNGYGYLIKVWGINNRNSTLFDAVGCDVNTLRMVAQW